jgi:LacI family repressor for deo operon, udp, cdd, tsx, nupC, and nupG
MAVSMRDVAQLAGVSQRTVSNVVNDYEHVSAETRRRVRQAIETLRYRPNASAQKLRSGKSGLLALAVPEIATPYFAELADAVQRIANENGSTLLIDQTGGDRERELLVLDGFRSNIIDGLILSPLGVTAEDLATRDLDFATVLLGESINNGGLLHISVDNLIAAKTATEHLLSLGRKNIAAVGIAATNSTVGPATPRARGYRNALRSAGLKENPKLEFATNSWTRREGYAIGRHIGASRPEIDAVFCFNDVLALGLMKGLADAGRTVPEDIAVVGWDDIDEAAYSTPTLTTIAPNKEQIAQLAVTGLLQRINGLRSGPEEMIASFELIPRHSTGTLQPL